MKELICMEEQNPKSKKGYIHTREDRQRHTTKQKQQCILNKLAEGKSVNQSTKECGCGNKSYYRWKKYDEEFGKAIAEYFSIELEMAEEILKESIKENPNLLQFFLKHRHPEYKVKSSIDVNHNGLNNIEVKIILPDNYSATTPTEE
jgi:hypothetical protein